jgi:hypothetical protein
MHSMYVYTYIHVYTFVGRFICTCFFISLSLSLSLSNTHTITHTHTHTLSHTHAVFLTFVLEKSWKAFLCVRHSWIEGGRRFFSSWVSIFKKDKIKKLAHSTFFTFYCRLFCQHLRINIYLHSNNASVVVGKCVFLKRIFLLKRTRLVVAL